MRIWVLLFLAAWPVVAVAQSDDRSYLTALLEDNLSDIGRQVTITGFTGALTSQASLQSMTIADADGVWLTLNNVVLDWNRADLFRGKLSVNALTAKEIIVARAPVRDPDSVPSPESSGFSLPDLPVSINIGRIAADRIVLEDRLLGSEIEGTFEASMELVDGEGRANLMLDRTDEGPDGNITLEASYSNASGQLFVDLDATEDAGGIASKLLNLPGEPSTSLIIKGAGPVDDFTADIGLMTDGIDRLKGKIVLGGTEDGTTQFNADLAGDLAPLFLPEYAEFFGSDVSLQASGGRSVEGRMTLSDFALQTRSLAVKGNLAFAADGLPEQFALKALLASPDGTPVLLPLTTDQEVRIARANLDLSFDASKSDNWNLTGVIDRFDRAALKIERLSLDGSGKINDSDAGAIFSFDTKFSADGLAPKDPALALAMGSALSGKASGRWEETAGTLQFDTFNIAGNGIAVQGRGRVAGLAAGLAVTGRATAEVANLGRFSGMSGQALDGSATAEVAGTTSILGGGFDLTAALNGTDLRVGQTELDALLKGKSWIEASVARTETGTELRNLVLTTTGLTASAKGKIATAGSDIEANLNFRDLSVMGSKYRGAVTAKAAMAGTLQAGKIQIEGAADGLATGQTEADKLLQGKSVVSADLRLVDSTVVISSVSILNPQITADAKAQGGAGSQIDLTAKLANLALLLPEFPGPVTVAGTAVDENKGFTLNLRAQGPGRIDTKVVGRLARNGIADLAINGTGQAALANAFIEPRAISGDVGFDLGLKGPLRLSSLSGALKLSGGRITSPDLPFALQETAVVANLTGGQAQIEGTAAVSTGGMVKIEGSYGLASPNNADLAINLRGVVLRDPQLYETRASGSLSITGPMAGGALIAGQLNLGDTELQIPSSGIGGAEAIPDLRHVGEPGDVRATRARAGLLGDAGKTRRNVKRAYRLDLAILAPNRVFLRGRGLDAELGGSLRLAGTTANVVPEGALNLIRGRLDILGKRLLLTEAQLRLEGDFLPFIRIAASTESEGVTSSVLIEGLVNDPTVSFTSSPQLPQEEVLSRLLFGRGLETLSVFQAAQLAGAVASLAGRGGEGIVAKLRKGFGLDDLDVRTTDDGTASVRAGKYISRNVYSEIEVGQDGTSQIQLNLDLTDSVTVRGRATSDGTTGIGIVLEKDY